jgi:uncharacterized protein
MDVIFSNSRYEADRSDSAILQPRQTQVPGFNLMTNLIYDPWFYAVAIPAVLFIGLSKGGLGGAMGQLGVPLLALVVSPVQGAAIMLPILILMDIVALWSWRGFRDVQTLKIMLPGAMIGIFIGYLTAKMVTDDMVKLIVGVLGLWFVIRHLITARRKIVAARPHNAAWGGFWGIASGFTSFVAHAGGPPYQIYALPLKAEPRIYAGTSTVFFAVLNAVKLIPYFALGQFDATNLAASFVLFPIAPLATLAGAWLVKRMSADFFYPLMIVMMALVSVKLVWDGGFAVFS